jgi:cytochrome P450
MTLKEIEASSSVLVVAGSETTATHLLSTLKNLMQRPEKLQKLVDEIRSSFETDGDITISALENGLPYLKAVIMENLRYNPPVPTQIPTVIGKGGGHVCGEMLPEGVSTLFSSSREITNLEPEASLTLFVKQTCVGIPQFAAYRSTLNFTYPEFFIPERWLSPSPPLFKPHASDPFFDKNSFLNDNVSVLQPFSVGPRNCIGQYLAHAEMRLILAKVLWHFDPVFPGDMAVEERMEPFDRQKTLGLWVKKGFRVEMRPVERENAAIVIENVGSE